MDVIDECATGTVRLKKKGRERRRRDGARHQVGQDGPGHRRNSDGDLPVRPRVGQGDDYCDVLRRADRDRSAHSLRPGARVGPRSGIRWRQSSRRRLPALRRPAGRPVLRVVRLRLQHHQSPAEPPRRSALPRRILPAQAAPPPPAAPPPLTTPPPQAAPRSRLLRRSHRPPANAAAWTVVVTADRAYYDSVQGAGGPGRRRDRVPRVLPGTAVPAQTGTEVRVGRRSESRRIHPEIYMTCPPADPERKLAPARGARRGPRRHLVRRRSRVSERHPGQRRRNPGRRSRTAARRRCDPPGRLDRAQGHQRLATGTTARSVRWMWT